MALAFAWSEALILKIDGNEIQCLDDFHDQLKTCPGLPDFYGRNLDALFDVLTGFLELPLKIEWHHAAVSRRRLVKDFERLLATVQDAMGYTARYERIFEFELVD